MEICLPPSMIKRKQWGELSTETTSDIIHPQDPAIYAYQGSELLGYIQVQPAIAMDWARRRAAENMACLKQPAAEGFQDRCVPGQGTAVLSMSPNSTVVTTVGSTVTPCRGSHFKDPAAPTI